MPGATALVEKSSITTERLDWFAAKRKPSGLTTGSFISPAAGAAMPATGRMLSAGSGACSSPSRCSPTRSEEHTSELQSLKRITYAVFSLKNKTQQFNDNLTD